MLKLFMPPFEASRFFGLSVCDFLKTYSNGTKVDNLLSRLRSIAAHRDLFVQHLSVRLFSSHTFLVVTLLVTLSQTCLYLHTTMKPLWNIQNSMLTSECEVKVVISC